jgi:hypothetical protein
MPTTLPDQAISWIGRDLLAVFLASLVVLCGMLVIYGPQMRAASEANEARIVEQEDKVFCGTFGIGSETGRYAECAAGLKEIRACHLEERRRFVGEALAV